LAVDLANSLDTYVTARSDSTLAIRPVALLLEGLLVFVVAATPRPADANRRVLRMFVVGASLTARTTWPVLAAFVLWGMASHAFGAVQDVRADREGGIASVATALGAHATVVAATVLYLLAAAVLLLVPWPGTLAAVLPIPYAISTAQFWSVRDDDCERANAGWRRFLWLNLVTGFLVTMLLIVIARAA